MVRWLIKLTGQFMKEIMFGNREKEMKTLSDRFNSPQKSITRNKKIFRKR